MSDFIKELAESKKSILIVANTKACAKQIYESIRKSTDYNHAIFHLSTNMCAEHRKDCLDTINSMLDKQGKVICISTQLIEAGVDISFECVIRSQAGLDSLIQTAGRCNRHGDDRLGQVYIVKMSKKAENLSHLKDIRMAQEAMEETLAKLTSEDLLSEKSIITY